jgi:hypothetical protein
MAIYNSIHSEREQFNRIIYARRISSVVELGLNVQVAMGTVQDHMMSIGICLSSDFQKICHGHHY